jgi:hypothetical protein
MDWDSKTMKCFFLIICLFSQQVLFCQSNKQIDRTPYCECRVVGEKIPIEEQHDTVFAKSTYDEHLLDINVINSSKDTIYLFKSYFDYDISESQILYRYNKKESQIKMSFIPLLPFLFTKYNDRTIITKNRIIEDFQTVYDFFVIPPYNQFNLKIDVINIKNKKDFIADIDIKKLNKFRKIKFKKVKISDKQKNNLIIELAYYKDISLLCSLSAYFYDEYNFNVQAKDFCIISFVDGTL